MKTSRIVADIKCLTIFTCSKCSKERAGATLQFEADVTTIAELVRSIECHHVSNNYMPVGWASYYDGIRCDDCNAK